MHMHGKTTLVCIQGLKLLIEYLSVSAVEILSNPAGFPRTNQS